MKKLTSKHFLKFLEEYAWITLGGILNAVSLFTFINPATLIAGGFSGLSSALSHVFVYFIGDPGLFDNIMSITYFVLNIPLLICSLIFLRGDFTFKTIWATIVSTVVLAILPEGFKFSDAADARLVSIIFGGILIGLAMYVAAQNNGSNGGTEIIARIVSKYRPEIDLSKVIMIANFIITVSGSIVVMCVVEGQHVDVVIYSLMYVLIGSSVLGLFKRGFNHPQKFLIITTEFEQIGEDISKYFKRGYSFFDVTNSYDGKERKLVMVVVQYRQMYLLKQFIKARDPHAFTIVKDVYDVFSRPTFNRSYKTK